MHEPSKTIGVTKHVQLVLYDALLLEVIGPASAGMTQCRRRWRCQYKQMSMGSAVKTAVATVCLMGVGALGILGI